MDYSIDHAQRTVSPTRVRCRRTQCDRRVGGERRAAPQACAIGGKRSFKAWVRTFTNPRSGVDRRKGIDRRKPQSDRTTADPFLLTPEEFAVLLKNPEKG